ncbi:MAG: FAD-binding oxidoreductase [Planctomycetes bacterium]|nr:FAD-binding oxidoreductase [Planctomycetota bacterium]
MAPVQAHPISLPVLDERERRRVHDDLVSRVQGEIRFGRGDRMLYATDASIFQVEPIGVVIPASIADGIEAVRTCAQHGIAILPRGGGTALAGQTVNEAVVIDFSAACRSIERIDAVHRRAVVEPGVVLDQLNQALLPFGLMFGPDVATSSHATIGGMIGNNSAGANSILFGRTVEHVIALDVVLADGRVLRLEEGASVHDADVAALTRRVADVVRPLASEVRRRFPTILRHTDGLNLDLMLTQIEASDPKRLEKVNLAHLFCGSEGTLGTALRAEVSLVERPKVRGLAILGFESVEDALAPLAEMLATKPSAVELVDDMVIEMAKRNALYSRDVSVMPTPGSGRLGAVMYVQWFGQSEAEIAARMDDLARRIPSAPIARHFGASQMEAAWRLRKAGEPLLHAVPGDRKPLTFVEDTAVDPSRLAAFVREFRAIVERHGSTAAYYAHASVGCLHIRPLVCAHDEQGLRMMQSIASEVADLVVRHHGALSGEHGDGRVRSPLLTRVLGAELMEGIRRIKAIFDPKGLMNPGNLVAVDDPALITSRLRVRPDDRHFVHAPADTQTFFRYENEGGFDHALEQCNGAGLCRRLTPGGTMCPSYRVLKDEKHTTRGRANALRLAITGQLGEGTAAQRWQDPFVQETLGLCLSCKACKTECPSNVDLSKLKAEYAAQGFWRRGRVPWRTKVLGSVREVNRLASALWPLSEVLRGLTPTRVAVAAMLGFAPERSLPPVGPSLRGWLERRANKRTRSRGPITLEQRPAVLLMPDCFSQWSEPQVGRAAVELLEALGYRVVLPHAGCCGRAAISCGMLADAARTSAETARSLVQAMRREEAVALLGLEPSCVSAVKDDWLDLKMSVPEQDLRWLAARTWMAEEWIDLAWDRHPRKPHFVEPSEQVVLHAHCHQKALWGPTSIGLLRRVFGDRASVLQTGCCGMAGSFGFRSASYPLSQQIAQADLLPKLAQAPEAIVAAPGTSCRHQIHDGCGRTALHPIEIVVRAIDDRVSADASVLG